jgi:hypothetical protein
MMRWIRFDRQNSSIKNHHPVCGFAAATPPGQEGRSLEFANYIIALRDSRVVPGSNPHGGSRSIPRLSFHSLQNNRQRSIVIERDGFCCDVYSYLSGHDSASFPFAF